MHSEYCALIKQPMTSALQVTTSAGSIALPSLIKYASLASQKKNIASSSSLATNQAPQHLAMEIDMGPEFQFHSIFACPVSKEQTTPENPPMMLPCGHVISKEALQNLTNNYRYYSSMARSQMTHGSERFKCPYCPQEGVLRDCKQLFF